MPHVTHIELENFRSFRKASCRLSPFTLVVGANNSGKSNLLRAISEAPFANTGETARMELGKHHSAAGGETVRIELTYSDGGKAGARIGAGAPLVFGSAKRPSTRYPIYRIDPNAVSVSDAEGELSIGSDGGGIARVLERLRSGPRASRDLADRIERDVSRFVPEVEAISVYAPEHHKRGVQIEQRGIERAGQPFPVPLAEASEGTRLIVAIAMLANLDPLPEMLLLEDIDRALHPRLFEKLVDFLRGLTRNGRVQIIATCHNSYLGDEFFEEPGAVVVVEKEEGESVLSNLDDRLAEAGATGKEMPLGQLWFSGLVGGVPQPMRPPTLRAIAK